MEDWEKELRKKLEKELPEGGYQIGEGKFTAITGKGGAIDFYVAVQKSIRQEIQEGLKDGDKSTEEGTV